MWLGQLDGIDWVIIVCPGMCGLVVLTKNISLVVSQVS